MNKFLLMTAALVLLGCLALKPAAASEEEKKLAEFIKKYEAKASVLEKNLNVTEWNAYISGKKEDYAKMSEASMAWTDFHSDREAYRQLKEWKNSGSINSYDLKRKLDILINTYGPNQFSPELLKEINERETKLQQTFNSYRGKIDGKAVTERDIYEILEKSPDTKKRQAAWEAQKGVGEIVAEDLKELVRLRNKGAQELGFSNYWEMSVSFADQNPAEIVRIFKGLADSTDKKFSEYKKELDKKIAKRVNKQPENLKPWDYSNPFFQSETVGFAPDISKLFRDRNIPLIAYNFYDSIALPLGDVLKNSDLYEKEGKSQHAFCFDMDRSGDSRILMNIRSEEGSLSTLLHESGHAVYNLNVSKSLPWIYRTQAHTLTTESSAMFFEKFTKNPEWLLKNLGINLKKEEKEGIKKQMILSDLIFCRWTIVMLNFEKAMYENPDADLNELWWTIVSRYQGIQKPEGRNKADWASKIHLVGCPVYYHNYMLAELAVAQYRHTIGTKIIKAEDWTSYDITDSKAVGKWFRDNIYRPGAKYQWNELIKKATGEELNPKWFAESL